MIYADYSYYTSAFLGNAIAEENFLRLATQASRYIDYITQNRAEKNADLTVVKDCCCALAERYQAINTAQDLAQKSLAAGAADGAEVQSESVGSWSRSYRSVGDISREMAEIEEKGKSELYSTAQQYLSHSGLLYRGGRRCW